MSIDRSSDDVTNESLVGLPPLQRSRKAVWDYYRIEFFASGYPGRRDNGKLQSHPLYGPYVIADNLAQYRRTKIIVFLGAACRVVEAAIAQMTEVQGGLAFVYDNHGTNVSSRADPFYSCLTQARYINALRKLLMFPEARRSRTPLEMIVKCIAVPVDLGGVSRVTQNDGFVLEEYPAPWPDCTLNGWTTATVIRLFAVEGVAACREGGRVGARIDVEVSR